MAFHLFLCLLVVCFILSLTLLWRFCWQHLQPSHSQAGQRRTTVHRLRHRPAAQTIAPPVVSPTKCATRLFQS
jgi:hypothetical protein